jgi:hypothetical protein
MDPFRFVPRTGQRDFIHIKKGSGCHSKVGRCGGMQEVSLGSGCVYTGIAVHELMHAVGFWHEQSRFDRDAYVRILTQNIMPSMIYNFEKMNVHQIDLLKSKYDTCSVMHYNAYAFTKASFSFKHLAVSETPCNLVICSIEASRQLSVWAEIQLARSARE